MLKLKQNDTGLGISAKLSNIDSTLNLKDAEVYFNFNGHKIKSFIECEKECIVNVFFTGLHLQEAGFFNCEFKVYFKDGRRETYPDDGYMKISIIEEV